MELQIRKGTAADTEKWIRFLETVQAEMSQKDWLYLDPPETMRQMMAEGIVEL